MQVRLLDSDTIGIFFEYNPKTVSLVKSIPGVKYQPKERFWYFGFDGITLDSLKQLEGSGFIVSEGVWTRLGEFTRVISDLNASKLPEALPLYPFQRETAEFMLRCGSCLNANFVGSGKSLTTLAICSALRASRILIIAPKSVVGQWREIEIPKWIKDKSEQAKYAVVGYERARIDIEAGTFPLNWDIVVCDEVHRLANSSTKLYKQLSKLRSKYRFGLSATPIMNAVSDVYGVMNWIRPGMLGSFYQFLNRYIVKGGFLGRQIVGNKNVIELARRIEPFIIKKTLEEVGMQLPPYTEEIIPVELNEIERKNYNLIKSELLFDIEKHIINKIENPVMLQNTVVKLGKLFELCDHMSLIGEEDQSSKLEALKEHLESRLANGEKAIIITRFERMARILEENLKQYVPLLITGATSKREEILRDFNTGPTKRILIGTGAIEAGLNLQVANVLYNYDSAWNPARMEQRAGRIYRNGQEKPVFIYNLVTNKTVEGWLQKKLIKKQELSTALLPKSFAEIKEILLDD